MGLDTAMPCGQGKELRLCGEPEIVNRNNSVFGVSTSGGA